jgi:hypothetical protein
MLRGFLRKLATQPRAWRRISFLVETGVALALEQWKLALPGSRLSFQPCAKLCERKRMLLQERIPGGTRQFLREKLVVSSLLKSCELSESLAVHCQKFGRDDEKLSTGSVSRFACSSTETNNTGENTMFSLTHLASQAPSSGFVPMRPTFWHKAANHFDKWQER